MSQNDPLGLKIIAAIDIFFALAVVTWSLTAVSSLAGFFKALLSSCPCTLLAKIAVLVILLLVFLLVKSGIQIFMLDPKGREDHIGFSKLGIFVLCFPLLYSYSCHQLSTADLICGALMVYLLWSIFYLNSRKIKNLFRYISTP
jgi:hypothetical protein